KTTLISNVDNNLNKVMDVYKSYLGSGDGNSSLLRKPFKALYKMMLKFGVLNRKSKRVDEKGKTYRVKESKNANIIRKLGENRCKYNLDKERKKKLYKTRRFRNKGYVVVTDRYPQNTILDMADGPKYYSHNYTTKSFFNKMLINSEKKCFQLAEITKPDIV